MVQKAPQANISYLIAGAGVNDKNGFTWGLIAAEYRHKIAKTPVE